MTFLFPFGVLYNVKRVAFFFANAWSNYISPPYQRYRTAEFNESNVLAT
jgi:hypothetical protein